MSKSTIETKVSDIKQGDEFIHDGKVFWTAVGDAFHDEGTINVRARFLDGSLDERIWDNPNQTLQVQR